MKKLLLILGILLLFSVEILQVYFIMPFPGSQKADTIGIAYFLHNNIWYLRIVALVLIVIGLINSFSSWKKSRRIAFVLLAFLYCFVFYMVNFRLLADKMFYQPTNKNLVSVSDNRVTSDKLVVGVTIKGQSKAYPVEIIGYHHQVQDTIGGEPVMVTYCTVCRTGRVYSPFVNGKKESFRLVGMDHFNAMFEDSTTKSWWRQVNGEAITGPLKGQTLKEIPSEQTSLAVWMRLHPNTLIMQPDSLYKEEYADLVGFDNGTIKGDLEHRDSASWQFKSWVIGVEYNKIARAYDWNELVKKRVINDSLPKLPVVLVLESDNASFHVWNRSVNNQSLEFYIDNNTLKDKTTNSVWNFNGVCIFGPMAGQELKPVQASQEFWHSWQTFHPKTSIYK
ncbi:MAG: DUF3179 domain-containing protein [Bacteroidetes bacterium]|nr:DUF3179 domain-containing protein [Bacteroidota bacterium]